MKFSPDVTYEMYSDIKLRTNGSSMAKCARVRVSFLRECGMSLADTIIRHSASERRSLPG